MNKLLILLFFLIVCCGIATAANNEGLPTTVGIGTTNLVSYWTYDTSTFTADWGGWTKSASSATNVSGCQINGCVYFDGANDYINYTSTSMPSAYPVTFLYWGKAYDTTTIGYHFAIYNGATLETFARYNELVRYDGGQAGWAGGAIDIRQNLSQLGLAQNTWVMYGHTINSTGWMSTFINGANKKGLLTGSLYSTPTQLMLSNRPG
jgi:hypothetical protein